MSDKELDSILNEIKKRNGDSPETDSTEESAMPENDVQDDAQTGAEDCANESAEQEAEPTVEDNDSPAEEQEPEYQEVEATAEDEYIDSGEFEEEQPPKKDNKRIIIIAVAVIAIIAIICAVYFGFLRKPAEPETTASQTTTQTTDPVEDTTAHVDTSSINPLTGEAGFAATGKRPVAIVVENAPAARPQWGIDSPDIIVEGDVEGGISRMLWIYADYNSVPDKVGPLRSARPSYVKMSALFDAVFIHWGGSHSKDGYTGGYETIKNEGVDDIDGIKGGALFSRDKSRNVSSEHTGVLDGSKIEGAINDKGYRTELKDGSMPSFEFFDEATDVSTDKASDVKVKFSSSSVQTKTFTYDTSDSKYHTSDWSTDVSFENIIVLMASTNYVSTSYHGYTSRITYVNYNLSSGSGYLASNGTYQKIKWSATSGTLKITDEAGNDITLNKGNSYIGLASSNNGGTVSFG